MALDWGEKIAFSTTTGGQIDINQTLLQDDHEINVSIAGKRQCLDKPQGLLMLALQLSDERATTFVQPGAFLFQACWEHDLDTRSLFVDVAGKIYTADCRIWGSKLLFLLHDRKFPTISPGFGFSALATASQGNQAGGLTPGLDDRAVWAAMRDLQDSRMCLLLPPIAMHESWIGLPALDFHGHLGEGNALFVAFQAHGHWALLQGVLQGDLVQWTYFDGLRPTLASHAKVLAKHLMKRLGLSVATWRYANWIPQKDGFSCGTIVIGHMALCLGLQGRFTECTIAQLHDLLRCRNSKTSWFSGLGPNAGDLQAKLAAFLTTKGVPADAAPSRAALAIQRLGANDVDEALQQSNAWQALKGLTNKPGRNFQYVLKSELQANIEAKAADKHGASISVKKKEKKPARKPNLDQWHLDPKLLKLDASHFEDEMEVPVEQIDLSQVVADSRGIALCSVADAIPYINEPKNISPEALALLILEDVPADRRAAANIVSLRFPVTYLPTKDPLLVNGCILQLGDIEVRRKIQEEATEMDVSSTTVLKVQIFRDEFSGSWQDVTSAPIRALIAAVPLLKLCSNLQCNMKCGCFHAAVEDPIDQVIHEIWSRKFLDSAGRQCPSGKADLFIAFMRIAEPALDSLLKVQQDGIYFEPRANGPRTANMDFFKDVALHKLKLLSAGMSLVRLKQRYGIRVPVAQEKASYKELRPGDTFVKVDVNYIFRAHPLPHGIQRAQVAKMLTEWQWSAKPLQPAKGSSQGCSWDLGAATQPPNTVMRAFGEDILLTLVKDKTVEVPTQGVIGPKRVQSQLNKSAAASSSSSPGGDPWWNSGNSSGQDPWGTYAPTSSVTPATQKRLDEMATKLRTDLTENMNTQMASSTNAQLSEQQENRLKRLEVGLNELNAQGKQFSKWFQESGARIAAQDQQLSQLQAGLVQQQADLQAVRAEIHTSADNLHQAMGASFNTMKSEIANQVSSTLSSQLERFEAMLTGKLQRKEWLGRPGSSAMKMPGFGLCSFLTFWLRLVIFFCAAFGTAAFQLPLARHFELRAADLSACYHGSEGTGWLADFRDPCSHEDLLLFHPWGEALNPGPRATDSDSSLFWLGFSNPTGMRGKEDIIMTLGTGIWSFSETQLSSVTQRSTSARLKFLAAAQHRELRILMGAPVAFRPGSSWAGGWAGVATIADVPSRELQLPYNNERSCGRIMTSLHYVAGLEVTNVTVYGFPAGPTWPQHRELTTTLLQTVTTEVILGGHGVRIVGGDFNVDSSGLALFDYWRQLGWRSAQEFAEIAWDQAPMYTCKAATERDIIWLCPEAQAMCGAVDVSDFFAEHSTVSVGLRCKLDVPVTLAWPLPSKIPWADVDVDWADSVQAPEWNVTGTTNQQWAQLWKTLLRDTSVRDCDLTRFLDSIVALYFTCLTLLEDALTWHFCKRLWLDTLPWQFCRTLLLDWHFWKTLLRDTSARDCDLTPFLDSSVGHFYLIDLWKTLLRDTSVRDCDLTRFLDSFVALLLDWHFWQTLLRDTSVRDCDLTRFLDSFVGRFYLIDAFGKHSYVTLL